MSKVPAIVRITKQHLKDILKRFLTKIKIIKVVFKNIFWAFLSNFQSISIMNHYRCSWQVIMLLFKLPQTIGNTREDKTLRKLWNSMYRIYKFRGHPCPTKIKYMKNFLHYKLLTWKFSTNMYVAIAMHMQHNYTDVLLQNISRIQGYPSPPAEVIPQNSFPCSFQ